MNFTLYIAKRYFLSKNKNRAVNYMSVLALLGIVFSAAAMIIVLSGFSGLKNYSLEFLSYASPELEISSKKGKRFVFNENMKSVLSESNVDYVKCISERAVMSINGGKKIVSIKSLDENFPKRNIDSILYAGSWPKKGEEVVVGWGLAYDLGVSLNNYENPINFFVPVPGKGQALQAKDLYSSRTAVSSGIFNLNEELNNNLVYADFLFAQKLFEMKENEINSIEVYGSVSEKTTEDLKGLLGNDFYVKTKLEQNEVLYKMLKTEELAVFLIFSLIVVVALFNMFGALIMIFLEKKSNLKTLSFLGLTKEKIGALFTFQGLYITVFGCFGGLALGSILLSLQNYFSILNLAPNLPYPVSFELKNFLLTFIIVIIVGAIVSYSVSILIRKNFTKSLQQ
ncbi:MAG: ABC transporter permease [Bacteroidetes bacterium MED-G13]|nr:MAG: ABC transporter permease [Bacteroidetes bacterium MED-G13]